MNAIYVLEEILAKKLILVKIVLEYVEEQQ